MGVGGYFVTRDIAVGCEGCAGLREDVTAEIDIQWHYSDETAHRVAYFMQTALYAPSL